ncbi:MAG: ChaN family lipoprotein [Rhodospirillales bacterium]|nr:ChaN family lipoprotein [Rhodospirillales bacterium]MCB9997151.1 ChaN family lipoprotein [Rhodospirillales bacterium]
MNRKFKEIASVFALAASLTMPMQLNAEPQDTAPQAHDNSAAQVNLSSLNNGDIVDVSTGTFLNEQQLIKDIAKARVIYIGETHNNVVAHLIQARILKQLAAQYPGQIAVGMEMFKRSAQGALDDWHNGKMSDADFDQLFQQEWGFDPEIYRPLLAEMKKAGTPIIGLRPTDEMENKFSRGEAGNYPDMDQNDALHRQFNMQILQYFAGAHGHAATDTTKLEKHYQKQLLRDETMGETVANFLADPANKDKKLVVIAGDNHVEYGLGIPKRAERRVPHDYTIILPDEHNMSPEINRVANGEDPSIPAAGNYVWQIPFVDLDMMKRIQQHLKQQQAPQNHPAPQM